MRGIDITSPSAASVWPAYNRLWVKIAHMMLRVGRPVLVLCPLTPDEIEESIQDAEELRASVSREFSTTDRGPAEAAAADWITGGSERHPG
ncbi:hypothetical protein AB0B50_01960 [Streptomyces sp. NPDC041068]|uniref:hypothetical protein n=1 Tax=Streptomyces sp. NPDC041068 TaxID=3155130 RepID=UPI003409872A